MIAVSRIKRKQASVIARTPYIARINQDYISHFEHIPEDSCRVSYIYNTIKRRGRRFYMIVNNLSFGSITIDGETYVKDVIIVNGSVKKRKKKESKKYSDAYGHTPLSPDEKIPWNCKRLVIGTGHSSGLPVMDEVYKIAVQKGVELVIMSTPEAIKHINDPHTNFILHLTC